MAGVLMLYGEPEKAFEYLGKMVDTGFGKTYYQYSLLTRSSQYKFLWQSPRWNELITKAKNNFIKQIKADGDNVEAAFLFQEDQADRLFSELNLGQNSSDELSQMILRVRLSKKQMKLQWERQNKMRDILKKKKLKTVNDYYSSVFIFQHSVDSKDIKSANELARQGYNLAKTQDERCKMGVLISITTDRLLWYQGKPQIYGTQSRSTSLSFKENSEIIQKTNLLINKFIKHGEDIPENILIDMLNTMKITSSQTMTIDPIDINKITDEQRKKLCVRPLEYFLKKIEKEN